jgi:hypothetical protein
MWKSRKVGEEHRPLGREDGEPKMKGLAAQAMTDLPEHGSLGVRELQSPIQLALQDAVFRGQQALAWMKQQKLAKLELPRGLTLPFNRTRPNRTAGIG